MNQPFFTIITCTYNSAKYVGDNINSAESQIFSDYEHIFIDGFSSDETIELLNNYKSNNSNVKIIQSEPKGIADAMNVGIKNANGKYLLFLNSDDYFFNNNALKNVFELINEDKESHSWYYGIINTITEDGRKLFVYPHRKYQKIFCYWLFRFTFFMQHPATFYSRELFSKYGLYDESLYAMDYEYAIRIGKKEKAKFMDIVISNFRVGGFSSKNEKIMEADVKKIFQKYYPLANFWFFIRSLYIKLFVK